LGGKISSIRIIKFLYLIDWEYFQRKKKILTGINWVKYSYGPYFFDWPILIKNNGLDLEINEFETKGKSGRTYRTISPQNISKIVDYPTESLINKILEKWADEETKTLLDYVYSTPPVKNTAFNKLIDFSLFKSSIPTKKVRIRYILDIKIKTRIQSMLESNMEAEKPKEEIFYFDDDYIKAINDWDKEDTYFECLPGKVSIKEDDSYKAISEQSE
jgi:CRISPR/Cas system CMR-associated protein Cmr5 small subunit